MLAGGGAEFMVQLFQVVQVALDHPRGGKPVFPEQKGKQPANRKKLCGSLAMAGLRRQATLPSVQVLTPWQTAREVG